MIGKSIIYGWDESETNAYNISEYRIRQGAMKAYKFRLYPSVDQEKLLNNQLNLCRELYNAFLQQRIYACRSGKHVGYNHQAMEMPELKNAFPEYRSIHSQVLQDVARRVDKSYDNFYRRIREKKN